MMKEFLMGIDIGTSSCKVAVFTTDGEVVAQCNGNYRVYYPQRGWAEQDPDEWWDVVCSTISLVLKSGNIDPADIRGIGVDGQSWSAIAVDEEGQVLCNNPIWMDTRAAEICSELKASLNENEIFDVSGNPLEPAYTLPKILWYKKNRPDIYEKTYKILQSNSFIVYRLSGAITQDVSQGYGLQCFDMHSGNWNYTICEKLGIDINLLPEIVQCHKVVGYVTDKAAEATGLFKGTPVVAGGLDAACGTLGAGVVKAGQTQEQGGQAGGMSICMDKYCSNKKLILSFHVVPDLWLLQGGTVGGGGTIKWFEEQLGEAERISAKANDSSPFYEMDKKAKEIVAGCDGVIFLPYMAGERSPVWDKHAKGVYYGLDYSKNRGHLIRATMEGVAYSLQHNLETAEESGADTEVLCAMGGAANSRLWTQIKADVTGKKIIVPASDTATALGAAILAGVGTGIYSSFKQAVEKTVKIQKEYLPDMDNHQIYQRMYKKYLCLYQCLKTLMSKEEL